MFGPPGIAYVYLVYGMHHLLNVVADADGQPAAVLIRAVEPLEGQAAMGDARLARALRWARGDAARARAVARIARLSPERLAAGPGLVTAAFGISLADTGTDLLDSRSSLRIEAGAAPERILETARIGIDYASEPWRSQPWRFVDPGSPSLSSR